jgi:hypothetical protein
MQNDAHGDFASDKFEMCWQSVGPGFVFLKDFYGSIAAMMAGIASVESDFPEQADQRQ